MLRAAFPTSAQSYIRRAGYYSLKVNECRSVCKDYWRLVIAHCEMYRDIIPGPRLMDLRSAHARFVPAVKPLDNLAGYTTHDDSVYSFDTETSSNKQS
jgi:hypothetical protein